MYEEDIRYNKVDVHTYVYRWWFVVSQKIPQIYELIETIKYTTSKAITRLFYLVIIF